MSTDELLDAEAALAACHRARARAEVLQSELAAEQETCQAIRRRVGDERADLSKLKRPSAKSLLARLRGRRDDLMTTERAELLAAEAELATHESAMRRLSAEFEAARRAAQELPTVEARLAAAIERREREVAEGDDQRAAELLAVDRELAHARAVADEVRSAHLAALRAEGALAHAIGTLGQAQGWSAVDFLSEGSGGFKYGSMRFTGDWAGRAKHDQLDNSVVPIAEAHASLLRLRAELTDVSGAALHQPNVRMPSSGLGTLDVWFDNRFSDLMVHDRISSSISELERAKRSVEELLVELEPRVEVAATQVERLESARAAVLRGD